VVKSFLSAFVAARFWVAPGFLSVYYLQLNLAEHSGIRKAFLIALLGVLGIALPANYLWIVDYRERLNSGISFVRSHSLPNLATSQSLEQARWANAKILGIIVIVLSVCSQFSRLGTVPSEHRVPILTIVVLIFIALFDAALDLEAEWTISLWLSSRISGTPSSGRRVPSAPRAVNLAAAMWHTNQFRKEQIKLFNDIHGGHVPAITFLAFSSTAQNLLSFAALIVGCTITMMIVLLMQQLKG
jgi:hypothetical protein